MNKMQLLYRAALALLSIVVTLCLYVSHLIYFSQREYFTVYFSELVLRPLLYAALAGLLVWLILAIIPRAVLKRVSAVLLMLALLCWLQSDVFSVSYGLLDGSILDFARLDQRGYWEIFVLAGALIMALLFSQFVNKHMTLVIGLIMLGQLVLTGVNVFNEPRDKPALAELDEEFFNYSTDKNIIIIILDTFGSEFFQDILLQSPDFKKEYPGFVSYTDAISNYPATKGSLPSLLTGQMIPKDIKISEYIKNVVGEKGLPAIFDDKGYEVSVISSYTWFRNFFPERYMSEPPLDPDDLKQFNSALLFDYSLFRLTPHFLKHWVYDDGNWLLSSLVSTYTHVPNTAPEQANMFLEMMTDKAVKSDKTNRFKLIHVKTPHPKFVFNQDCEKIETLRGVSQGFYMEQQSRCALKKLNELLQKYKDMGIYDDSLIVVASDHGARVFDDRSFTGFPSYFELNSAGPMFMIKGIGQKAPFRQVNQPFSLIKLFDALVDSSLHHSSYDDLIDKQRLFYAFKNGFKGASGMMQDAPLYSVGANYQNLESWELKELVVNNCIGISMPLEMTFKSNAREQYCGLFGFGLAEANGAGAWTESVDARIVFNLDHSKIEYDNLYRLEITLEPKLYSKRKEFEMSIKLNDKEISSTVIKEPEVQTLVFDVPAEYFKTSGSQELKFLMPGLKSEHQMDLGSDTKIIGVLMKSIVMGVAHKDS